MDNLTELIGYWLIRGLLTAFAAAILVTPLVLSFVAFRASAHEVAFACAVFYVQWILLICKRSGSKRG